ncbi:helicase [Aureococcus anophagefferens]|nr:helicase [Aureococcus anophagefferens]
MSAVDAKASKKRKAEASSAAFDEAAAAAGEKAKKPKKTPEEKAAKAAKKAAKAAKAAKEAAAAEGAAPAAAAEGAAPAAAPAAAAPEKKRPRRVLGDFSDVAHGRLRTLCVYGGSAYGPSCDALRRGVDVVVGTPGRTMDLIEKGVLDASALSFALLLFSATLPPWVRNIAKAYAQTDVLEAIDLVGSAAARATASAASSARRRRTCRTSRVQRRRRLKEITYERRALHGDIPQALREKTMAAFRAGQFKILVATDVAARGLDMVVELVVNNKPPATRSGWADAETYVHRSGRTGRAGRKGTCVTLYQTKHRATLEEIERKTKNAAVEDVAPSALPCFEDRAAALAANFAGRHGSSATGGYAEALRAALAKLAGYERGKPADRSLLTNSEHYVTCHYAAGLPIHSISYVWNFLRRELKPEVCDALKAMQLVAEGDGAVFDAPASAKADLVGLDGVSVDIDDLPKLKERAGGKGGKGKGAARQGRRPRRRRRAAAGPRLLVLAARRAPRPLRT